MTQELQASIANLSNRDNLTLSLLDLLELREEIPEAALGNDIVGGEDGHLEERGVLQVGRGELTTDDDVLLQL